MLKDKVLRDNVVITENPTLTTTSEETNESGLYKSTDTNSGNPTYYFRGNIDNNYVDFAGFVWRIVRINEDGTIRLILQDGINDNNYYHFNSTGESYNYYTNSEAKTHIENWYNNNLNKELLNKLIVTGDYFCEQHKANLNYKSTSGLSYLEYIPNFKCTNTNSYGIVNSNIGLLTYDELIHAGGYPYKKNSNNYLYDNTKVFWTMSYADFNGFNQVWIGNFPSSYPIYEFYFGHNNSYLLRPVINLKENIIVIGTGNNNDKYFVQY